MRSTYGLNIVYVRFSAIFSTPRWRYPITHSVPRTFSPSSRRMTRSTPWVAGCCGPILMTSSFASRKVFLLSSSSRCETELFGSVILVVSLRSPVASFRSSAVSLPALDSEVDLDPLLVLLNDAVVFAQGMALPPVGQENAFQVRVAVELNAEHVEGFPLQPIGRC